MTDLLRLSRATLPRVPAGVARPTFDPARLRTGIVHLGLGSFHRAHQALATQQAIDLDGEDGLGWGIAAAAMKRPVIPELLWPQDGLYTLLVHGRRGTEATVVGSLSEVVHIPTDERGIAERIADPATRIVTLTVTASGYGVDPATGGLAVDDEMIRADLDPANPAVTPVGMVVRGLDLAHRRGQRPPVVISCDNLTANGSTLRRSCIEFAGARGDDALTRWIEGSVQFPSSVVDRIAAETDDDTVAEAARVLGLRDAAPVPTEPFFNWVIEDFEGPRPRWADVGVRFVSDVEPYEQGKLRLLNASHMLLAYLGALAGHETIAEASSDPVFERLTRRYMVEEQGRTLTLTPTELADTVDKLMERFQNPSIRHEMARIGRNGSDKMAARIMEAARENLAAGREVPSVVLLIAAWIRWFEVEDDEPVVDITDPMVDELKRAARETRHDRRAQAERFLAMTDVFGPDLPAHADLVDEVARALTELDESDDVRDVIAARLD